MRESLVNIETSQLLQQKGCNLNYCTCGGFPECICGDDLKLIPQSLAQKWLREVHNIYVSINDISELNDKIGLKLMYFEYSIKVYNKPYPIFYKDINFKTYEQALEVGLQEALKLIKDEKIK